MPPNGPEKPLPLRSVLTKPVVVTILNHAMFALLNMVAATYIPLVWSTPVEFGGLNLSPASIGLRLSVYGGMNGIFQFAFFSYLIRRFGLRNVFISSIIACAVIYIIFPFENLALRVAAGDSSNTVVWLLVILQLSALCLSEMGYRTFSCLTLLRTRLPVLIVAQLLCTYTFHRLFRTNDHSARRMVWRRWRRRFRAPLARLLRTGYLRSP
jgi:hypothetical protein